MGSFKDTVITRGPLLKSQKVQVTLLTGKL